MNTRNHPHSVQSLIGVALYYTNPDLTSLLVDVHLHHSTMLRNTIERIRHVSNLATFRASSVCTKRFANKSLLIIVTISVIANYERLDSYAIVS